MKTLVMGTGRSGLALSRFLLAQGKSVILTDRNPREQVENSKLWTEFAELESRYGDNLEWSLGGHPLELLDRVSEILISPGISLHHPFLQEALKREIRVSGEMELAFSVCEKPLVAVTGTNGKSTTCTVLGMMLGEQGVVGGNIGIPLLKQVSCLEDGVDWVVAEVSSFQLETVHTFRPKIGILTNISPDHLDHHKDLEEYRIAKSRMFHQMGEGDVAIFCADNDQSEMVGQQTSENSLPNWIAGFPLPQSGSLPKVLRYSARGSVENGIGISTDETGVIWVTKYEQGAAQRLFEWDFEGLPGEAMMSNGLAAVCAGLEMGLSFDKIQDGLRRFQPLRYRMELAGVVDGVTFINDSKATNIESALASAHAIKGNLALIVGGKDKGVDYGSLAQGLANRAARVFLIGEASEPIKSSLTSIGFSDLEERVTMGEALKAARTYISASGGGTVLLAPACSSFDQFKSAEQRGEIFNQMVDELMKQGAGS